MESQSAPVRYCAPTLRTLLVALMLGACSDSPVAESDPVEAVAGDDTPTLDDQTTTDPEHLDRESFIQNGYQIRALRTYASDGAVLKELSYSIDPESNLIIVKNELDGNPFPDALYTYDEQGRVESLEILDKSDPENTRVASFSDFVRNDEGRLLRIDTAIDTENSELTVFAYDTGGHVLARTTTRNTEPSPLAIATYAYDDSRNLASLTVETGDGEVSRQDTYETDASGWRIARTTDSRDADASSISVTQYRYDTAGNVSGVEYYNAEGALLNREEIDYILAPERMDNLQHSSLWYFP